MAPDVAVILAAGRGSRLGPLGAETPKALLPLGPRSAADATETCFLRRQAELLLGGGVGRVVVVVGRHGEQVVAAVAGWGLPVEVATNTAPDLSASGSLHSFWFAQQQVAGVLDGTAPTWLLDGDLVYDADLVAAMMAAADRTAVMVSPDHAGDDEEVRVYGTPDLPVAIGKRLRPDDAGGAACLGEATGVVRFAPGDHAKVSGIMAAMLAERSATEHEELSGRLMAEGVMSTLLLSPGTPFMECDDAADYARVRDDFYPRLLERERRG